MLVDNQTGYRWIYGIKTKDETIKVVKLWYSYIADLRARHKLVVVMSDNAGENNLKRSKNSSNLWEYEIISVRPRSNGKMGQLNQPLIQLC